MDQKEWEEKYNAISTADVPAPAALLQENADLLTGGSALDIATGSGQNAVLLAAKGYAVTGVDRSEAAVLLARKHADEKGENIDTVTADILEYGIQADRYDLIADFYFLERSLIPLIKEGLRPNGLVFFETYTKAHAQFGGPRNPAFLLETNELLSFFLDFFILFYHERVEAGRAVASLIARKI